MWMQINDLKCLPSHEIYHASMPHAPQSSTGPQGHNTVSALIKNLTIQTQTEPKLRFNPLAKSICVILTHHKPTQKTYQVIGTIDSRVNTL